MGAEDYSFTAAVEMCKTLVLLTIIEQDQEFLRYIANNVENIKEISASDIESKLKSITKASDETRKILNGIDFSKLSEDTIDCFRKNVSKTEQMLDDYDKSTVEIKRWMTDVFPILFVDTKSPPTRNNP